MSRVAYLDCVGGLAGDMLLAGLLDAGADLDRLRDVPAALGLAGVEISVEQVERHGVGALHLRIEAPDDVSDRDYREIRLIVEAADIPEQARSRSLEHSHGWPKRRAGFTACPPARCTSMSSARWTPSSTSVAPSSSSTSSESSEWPARRFLRPRAHEGGARSPPAACSRDACAARRRAFVGVDTEAELVTPTGAAIAATVVDEWGPLPPLTLERVGYGAGTKELDDRPNVVRVVIGDEMGSRPRSDPVVLLETNLDDFLPELVPDAVERCFAAGALDVWTVAAQMKKGRPGFVLSVLARPEAETAIARALLEETSALGVRVSRLERYELEREERRVEVAGGTVRVKIGMLDGRVVNVAPEHDDCAALARSTGRAVQSVWAEALARAQNP